jgi:hypothetical protein
VGSHETATGSEKNQKKKVRIARSGFDPEAGEQLVLLNKK